jgi:hypothetical protein
MQHSLAQGFPLQTQLSFSHVSPGKHWEPPQLTPASTGAPPASLALGPASLPAEQALPLQLGPALAEPDGFEAHPINPTAPTNSRRPKRVELMCSRVSKTDTEPKTRAEF